MQCEHFDRVQEYLDGRLAGPAAEDARAHLEACRDCARGARTLDALNAALLEDPRRDPGADFTASVMRAVRSAGVEPAWAALTRWEAVGLAVLYAGAVALLPAAIRWLGGVQSLAGWMPSPADMWGGMVEWAHALAGSAAAATEWRWAGWVEAPVGLGAAAAAGLLLILAIRPPASLQRIGQDSHGASR